MLRKQTEYGEQMSRKQSRHFLFFNQLENRTTQILCFRIKTMSFALTKHKGNYTKRKTISNFLEDVLRRALNPYRQRYQIFRAFVDQKNGLNKRKKKQLKIKYHNTFLTINILYLFSFFLLSTYLSANRIDRTHFGPLFLVNASFFTIAANQVD